LTLNIDHLIEDATTFMVMPTHRRMGDPRRPEIGDEVFLKFCSEQELFVEVVAISHDREIFTGRATQAVNLDDGSTVIAAGDVVEFLRAKISGVYKRK